MADLLYSLTGLCYSSSKRTYDALRAEKTQVDFLNEFKNATMPFLPLQFVDAANDHEVQSPYLVRCLLKHDTQGVNVFDTVLKTNLQNRLQKSIRMFAKHFGDSMKDFTVASDLEGSLFLERIMQIMCETLPSLRSMQEVPHHPEAVLLWLLTLYEKPEQAPHIGPKMSQEEDLEFIVNARKALDLNFASETQNVCLTKVRQIQKATQKHFVHRHSVTSLPAKAIRQTSFANEQALGKSDLQERTQADQKTLTKKLDQLSFVQPKTIFYVDPTPIQINDSITCKILVYVD